MPENCPELMKSTEPQIQEAQQAPGGKIKRNHSKNAEDQRKEKEEEILKTEKNITFKKQQTET